MATLKLILLLLLKVVRVFAGNYTSKILLHTGVGIPTTWDLGALLANTLKMTENDAFNFMIEGNSPCKIERASFDIRRQYIFKDHKPIGDFSIHNGRIYYVTEEGVKYAGLSNNSNIAFGKTIFPDTNYSYIETLPLPDQSLLVFLKNTTFGLSYTTYNGTTSTVKTLNGLQNFMDDMKISSYHNFVFVPGRRSGLFIYKYNPTNKELNLQTTLFSNSADINPVDIRDVAILKLEDANYVVLLIADYNKGIIEVTFNLYTAEVEYKASFSEFVNVKSVFSPQYGKTKKVMAIIEGIGNGVSKYIFLNYSAAGYLQFEFQDSLVIDGNIRYGDADNRLTVLILKNSLMVSRIEDRENIKFISLPGITHAKLYDGWALLFAVHKELILDKITFYNDTLSCYTQRKDYIYVFKIIAENLTCGNDHEMCSKKIEVTLESKDYEPSSYFKEHLAEIVLVVALILAFIITICCFAYVYRRMKQRIEQYEQLASARENLPDIA